ncbi:sulfite exporter TauE/SafE family protein [Microbaculum marinum]|uniref:Probable membrane transporter protein n=1 Tax=Microbaculum marinum TaxID=1764581 RepID=A0AAW9RUQ5_9HYPH
MITDPWFYLAAIPGVLLAGLAKGGFGGSFGMLAVPLMALVVSPVQAAAIMLPILICMDVVGLFAWRGTFDPRAIAIMVPAAMLGIAVGWATAAWVTEAHVRLIVGIVVLLFCVNYYAGAGKRAEPKPHNRLKGTFWGALTGFTSFVSHAGGPPFQMYMLPLRLDPKVFAGTAIIVFAVINAVKVVPYFFLGQLSPANLWTSAVLLPLAPLATLVGVWAVKRIRPDAFYRVVYVGLLLVSLKLIWDGASALL